VSNNSNITYIFAGLRDPKPMMKSVENYIHSQIFGDRVFLNGSNRNGFNYTTNTSSNNMSGMIMNNTNNITNNTLIRVELPWSHTPFQMRSNSSYLDNCKVFRYDGNNFVPTNSCVIVNGTDQNRVLLNCMYFDTVGVSCSNLTNSVNTVNNGGVIGNANSSSFRAVLTSFIAVLLMFVF